LNFKSAGARYPDTPYFSERVRNRLKIREFVFALLILTTEFVTD
jgi:hypothetical protein